MAATMNVVWDYGGAVNAPGTTLEAVSNLRFNAEDTNDQDLLSPLIKTGGTVYSYVKHVYMYCSVAPDTQISAMEVYTDGTLGWTGITVNVGDGTQDRTYNAASPTYAGYDPAVGIGQAIMTDHDTVAAQTSLFTYNSGSPRSVQINETSNIINAVNETTCYLVLQAVLSGSESSGLQAPAETITFSWSEI